MLKTPLLLTKVRVYKIILLYTLIRYDTRCHFNVRSKADMSQLNLPHENTTKKCQKNRKTKKYKRICSEATVKVWGIM